MIEIVFSPSMEGSLRVCRANGFLSADPKEVLIIDLNFMLDYGYLSGGIESEYRYMLPGRLYMTGYHKDDLTSDDISSFGEHNLKYWIVFKKIT